MAKQEILDQRKCEECGKTYLSRHDPSVFVFRSICPDCLPPSEPVVRIKREFTLDPARVAAKLTKD